MRKYRLVAKKGEGTFSEVLKAQNLKDGKYHAIKCMKNRFESIDQVNTLREIQALRRLSPHEHIITLEEVLYDQPTGRLALVFELMDANLYELIRGRRHFLNPQLIKSYMWQLMKALDHMHKKGIFHRDIKPENILIESTAEVARGLKLADFGSCRGIHSKQPFTEYISTRWYRAPECLLTDGYYGQEMDLWGAGCVLFEITSLYPLFPGSDEVDQINRIHKVLGTPTGETLNTLKSKGAQHVNFDFPPQKGIGIPHMLPHASADAIDLIVKMLKYDATERMSAREAMRHPYFKDVREAEAKQQVDNKQSQGVDGGMSSNVSMNSSSQHGVNSLPLPNIDHSNKQAQEPYIVMHKQGQSTNNPTHQMKLMNNNNNNNNMSNSNNGSSTLPPIGMNNSINNNNNNNNNIGLLGQQKYIDPKTGRTVMMTSNNSNNINMNGMNNSGNANSNMGTASTVNNNSTQKKRKKYRMNYSQQQRLVQNSESMMKAYGVPKGYPNSMEVAGASANVSNGFSNNSQYGQQQSQARHYMVKK